MSDERNNKASLTKIENRFSSINTVELTSKSHRCDKSSVAWTQVIYRMYGTFSFRES